MESIFRQPRLYHPVLRRCSPHRHLYPSTVLPGISGIGIICFSHIASLHIALAFAVIAGFGAMSQSTLYITIIQLNAEASMRGRIMSLFAMAVYGMMPLGSLFVGMLSHYIGAPNALLCQGLMALVITALFTRFLLRRRAPATSTPKEPPQTFA